MCVCVSVYVCVCVMQLHKHQGDMGTHDATPDTDRGQIWKKHMNKQCTTIIAVIVHLLLRGDLIEYSLEAIHSGPRCSFPVICHL